MSPLQPALDGIFPLFQKRSVDQNYLLGKASLIARVQIEKGKILSVFKMYVTFIYPTESETRKGSRAPNENTVQNHSNIALLNVF